MTWYGMTWCDMMWSDIVWHGIAWCWMAWCGMACYGVVLNWHDMVWHGMAWHHSVSSVCLLMVHNIVHSRTVLGIYRISCMSISGYYPLLPIFNDIFTQMSETLNTHIHVHNTQAYKIPHPQAYKRYTLCIAWHSMTWHDMNLEMKIKMPLPCQ